jgi:hypothetical protein
MPVIPRPHSRIGEPVRVLSGAARGAVGVIVGADAGATTYYRVGFEPPVYLPAVGHVASVWRTASDLEELPQPPPPLAAPPAPSRAAGS